MPLSRFVLLPVAITLALGLAAAPHAQLIDSTLPEMGSSAAELISPAEEQRYARQMLGEMRRLGMLLDDPLLEDYVQTLGNRLAVNSALAEPDFTFFLLRTRSINAFATLGGHIAVNAGLMLTAEREDELAAVMAHEITHVTQRHIVRGVEAARKDALPIALATLAAVLAAEQAGGDGDATQAAVASGMALMQQRQINFTRANEHEADRIGIQILARTGFDPMAMADFFGRMQRADRARASQDIPELLRSHPVTTTRISEAKDRARHVGAQATTRVLPPSAPLNPAMPGTLHDGLLQAGEPIDHFGFARERIRVLSADSSAEAIAEYRRRLAAGETLDDAERYGLALAQSRLGDTGPAGEQLESLRQHYPAFFWLDLALAENAHRAGRAAEADRRFGELLAAQPRNRAVVLAYAGVLGERGRPEDGQRAQAVLRPLLADGLNDPGFQRAFARAAELAGNVVRAGEAHAEAAFLNGRPEDALNMLQRLKDTQPLDYVERSRIDARIAAMTPVVLEYRAEGIRPDGERRQLRDRAHGWRIEAR